MDNLISPTLSFSNTPIVGQKLPVQTISDFTKLAVQTDLQNKASIDELQVLQKNVKSNNFGQEGEYLKEFIKNTDDDITSFSESNDMAYGTSFVNNLKKNFATDKTLQGIQASYQMRQSAIERSTKKNDEGWSNYYTNGAIGLGDERSKEGVHLDANGNVTGLYNAYELPKFSDVSKDLLEALSKAKGNKTTREGLPTDKNAPFEKLRSTTRTDDINDVNDLVREGKQYLLNDPKMKAVIGAMQDIDTYYAQKNGMFDNGVKAFMDSSNQGVVNAQLVRAVTTLDGNELQSNLVGVVGSAQAHRIANLPKDQRIAALSAAKLDLFQTAYTLEKQDLINRSGLSPEEALAKDKIIDSQVLKTLYQSTHADTIIQGMVYASADILDYHDSSITYSYMEDRAAVAENKRKADEDVWHAPGGDITGTNLMSLVKTTSDGLAQTGALLKASAPDLDFNNPTAAAAYFAKAGNTANVNALKEQYNNYLTLKETANQQNAIIRTSLANIPANKMIIAGSSSDDAQTIAALTLYKQGYDINEIADKITKQYAGELASKYHRSPSVIAYNIAHFRPQLIDKIHANITRTIESLPIDKRPQSTGIIMGMTGGHAERISSEITNAVINGTGNYDIISSSDGDIKSTADKNCTLSKANPNSAKTYSYTNPSLPAGNSYVNMTWTTGTANDLQHHSAIVKLQDGGDNQQRVLQHVSNVVASGTYDNNPSTKSSLNTSVSTGASNFVNAYPVTNDNKGNVAIQFGSPSSLNSKMATAFETASTVKGTQSIGTDIGIVDIIHAGKGTVSVQFRRSGQEPINLLTNGNSYTTSKNEALEAVTNFLASPGNAEDQNVINTHNSNFISIMKVNGTDKFPSKYVKRARY